MTALEIAAAVRAGERSARSVVEEHLATIDAREGELHAFNLVTRDAALAELRAAGIATDDEVSENEQERYAHFWAPDGQLYELVERRP